MLISNSPSSLGWASSLGYGSKTRLRRGVLSTLGFSAWSLVALACGPEESPKDKEGDASSAMDAENDQDASGEDSDASKPDEDGKDTEQDTGDGDKKTGTGAGDSGDTSKGGDASDSSGTGGNDSGNGGDERNCDQIDWGDELEEGKIIARGDVQGYVDQDGDNRVEQSESDAGMCQLHLTGRKCGLVLYSRRT